jgi:hypothetical protein
MANLILHHNGAYNIYCTISEGARYVSALTLTQLHSVLIDEGRDSDEIKSRLDRAHDTGCSSINRQTLKDCISCNRAGENEAHLSEEDFISQFLTLKKD